MKTAIVSRAALSAALATVKDIVVRRSNTIAVLSNVRLIARDGQLLATGTDLDIETTVSFPAGAIDEGFALTVPAHNLAEILKKAPAGDDLAIDADDVAANGKDQFGAFDFGGLRVKVQGIAESDFPQMGMSGDVVEFDIPTATFREALEAVAFAISTEETRYYLNGIYMHVSDDGLRMVTTDGHRLAHHTVAGTFPAFKGVLLPRKTVAHLLKITGGKGAPESLRIIVNHAKIRFNVGNVTVVSKLIDGTFPDYNRVIPRQNDKLVTFDRKAMMEALKAVGCVSSERGRAVKIEPFADGNCYRLRLSTINPDIGSAECDVRGVIGDGNLEGLAVGVNLSYVLDILGAIDAETVTLRMADSTSPMIFAAGESDAWEGAATFYVLMPMRV